MGFAITPGKTSTSINNTKTGTTINVGDSVYVALPDGYEIRNGRVRDPFGRTQSRYNGNSTMTVDGTTYVLDKTATSVAESSSAKKKKGTKTSRIEDTQYAYDVAVSVNDWREDFAAWEAERIYRQNQYEADYAYWIQEQNYNMQREKARYDDDLAAAQGTVDSNRLQTEEIQIAARKEAIQAEMEAGAALDKAAQEAASQKVNAAAFGSGRSSAVLLQQLKAEGAESYSNIMLADRLNQKVRKSQQEQLVQSSKNALNNVEEYMAPLAPEEPTAPVDYDAPTYTKPLEPNLEYFGDGVTEDDYISAAPEGYEDLVNAWNAVTTEIKAPAQYTKFGTDYDQLDALNYLEKYSNVQAYYDKTETINSTMTAADFAWAHYNLKKSNSYYQWGD